MDRDLVHWSVIIDLGTKKGADRAREIREIDERVGRGERPGYDDAVATVEAAALQKPILPQRRRGSAGAAG